MAKERSMMDGLMHDIHEKFTTNTNLNMGVIRDTEDKPLVKPVKYIGLIYPFTTTLAHWTPVSIPECRTRHELINRIVELCQKEREAGHNYGCHYFEDYYLESVEIWANGMAVFGVGA